RAPRPPARELGRSQRVRRQLERAEPERRQLPRRRRESHRRAGARSPGRLVVKVLGVSGSLRADSYNTRLLAAAAAAAPAGVEGELLEPALIHRLTLCAQELE